MSYTVDLSSHIVTNGGDYVGSVESATIFDSENYHFDLSEFENAPTDHEFLLAVTELDTWYVFKIHNYENGVWEGVRLPPDAVPASCKAFIKEYIL